MPHHFNLNRSFDTQLSPVTTSIIDWAPTQRGGPATAYRPPTGSPSVCGAPEAPTQQMNSNSPCGNGERHATSAGTNYRRSLQGSVWQLLVNSCTVVPLFARGTFSMNAGLFAGLGMAGGNKGLCPGPAGFHVNDVLQLEATWGKRQWACVFNLVCFSWMPASLPLCEFIAVTPRTDCSLQANRLMFNWSGFWRAFVLGNDSRCNSLISTDSPVERASSLAEKETVAAPLHGDEHGGVSESIAKGDESGDRGHTPSKSGSKAHKTKTNGSPDPDSGERALAVGSAANSSSVETSNLGSNTGCGSGAEEVAAGSAPGVASEWRLPLRELRCGLGVALKNDVVSAVNVYFGYSLHIGRSMTFSAHVDALRRGCYSASCSTASVDLATRLRVNHITSHLTELDAGIGWRPLQNAPGVTCRLSRSMGRMFAGISVSDVASQWVKFSGRGEETEQQAPITSAPSSSDATADVKSLLLVGWDACAHWGVRTYHSLVGAIASAWMGKAEAVLASKEALQTHKLGLLDQLSKALHAGADYCMTSVGQAKFDLTMGFATQRPQQPQAPKFFIVLSAY